MHSINVKHELQHIQHSINHSKQLSIPDTGNVCNTAQIISTWKNKLLFFILQFLWPTWIRKAQEHLSLFS